MSDHKVGLPVESVAGLLATIETKEMSTLHLDYINGSKMVGFRIHEATNTASSVFLDLITDTGNVKVKVNLEWGTFVEVSIS